VYKETSNPYQFQYLITGISGPGIECVYLPEKPPDNQILFKEEQIWTRPKPDKRIRKEIEISYIKADKDSKHYDPDYISPYAGEIAKWVDTQEKRFAEGVWFWNDGVATYITGFYYWYLTEWQTYFGFPAFRETDKEISYWINFWEEDPNMYGGLLNTIRRYGKSAIMAGWVIYRTTRNFKHYAGCQGETDDKVKNFWDTHIIKPFRKLRAYVKPKFDITSKQTEDIKFERATFRGTKAHEDRMSEIMESEFDEDDEVLGDELESYIDYRSSEEGAYDQAVLHSYVGEEAGKTKTANVNERWKKVKPCLKRGIFIRGKAFKGTTVEEMNVLDRGGKAYMKMFYESDYNKRNALNQTISGLCTSFLPGDCALEGYIDDHGRPMREQARRHIILERQSVEHNPKDFADLVRKYPLNISEIFWVSGDQCIFNTKILQKRKMFLDSQSVPMYSRYDLSWKDNKRFTSVIFRHNPQNGWFKASWMFPGEAFHTMANRVKDNNNGTYSPLNETVFTSGLDPVDHRVQITDRMGAGETEFESTRRSRPVMRIKRRYDSSIDGPLSQEILEKRRDEEYPYKTGVPIAFMDSRTSDPNVYYERVLLVCWIFGMSVNIESAKPGCINYLFEHGCQDFVKNKYIPESNTKVIRAIEVGTPANAQMINEYCDCLQTEVEYFGHCEPFIEFVNDKIIFDPAKTKIHDYTVADGWCSLGEKIRVKNPERPPIDLTKILNVYRNGRVVN